jgi:hypothetical protein
MNCRSCNTRLTRGSNTCPNCGHLERSPEFIDRPGDASGTTGPAAQRLAPSSLGSQAGESDYELEDEVELPLESAVGTVERPAARSATKHTVKKKKAKAKKATAPAKPSAPTREPASGEGLVLDAARIRQLIGEQPELIEAGLSAHSDDAGREIGLDFETDVGRIDLLGVGADGALVAVMIAEPGAGPAIVPDILLRMGWVRKHLVKSTQSVRGIVLLEEIDDELGYAAAAVADTVEFMTCRIAISFDRIEV